MAIKFFETIRDIEVEVTADDFDGDESVGVNIGPETVTATRLDNGEDFELTEAEIETLGIQATEIYFEDCEDFY